MDPNQIPDQPGQNQAGRSQPLGFGQNAATNQPEVQSQGQMPQPGQSGNQPSQTWSESSQTAPQAQVAQSQAMQSEPLASQQPKKGISKNTLMLLIILVVVVILTLIIYKTLLNREESVLPVPTPATPTVAPVQMTPEEELETIDAGDIDTDLQEIETDLQNL